MTSRQDRTRVACTPTWGGYHAYPASGASAYHKAEITAVKDDVTISFGGQAGSELAATCANVTALATAYQSVIDTYGVTHVDFDVEGAAVDNTAANTQPRCGDQAARDGQTASLKVSFTSRSTRTG